MNPLLLWFHKLGSPPYFYKFAGRLLPWLYAVALITGAVGFYGGLVIAPADYQQGDSFRIMYVHVPCAWMSLLAYAFMAANGFVALVWRIKLSETLAMASAPIGAAFTFITLVSGSVWGKPTWGTWWTWDARLTSTAVLFLVYVGYLLLRATADEPERRARFAAVAGIVGTANIPIVHFSVKWWRALHQPSTILGPEPSPIAPPIAHALAANWVAFTLLFAYLLTLRMAVARLEEADAA
jgi:heme exporter protein C